MARRRKILVPQAREGLDHLKIRIMKEQGYKVNPQDPNQVKFAVAKNRNIPLKQGYNGQLTSAQAGQVGGPIGGNMVKELVRIAQEQLTRTKR